MGDFTQIKAIGFDLDGTLVNSAPGLAAAVDGALTELGLPSAGETRVSHWIGNGANILMQRALKWADQAADEAQVAQARALFDRYYEKTVSAGSQLYPQVKETLASLAEHGIKMALVTNKPTPFVQPLLQSLGIESYFNTIVGGDDVLEKKPHPAPIYLILARLNLRAEELLFVGDSRNDIQAAQAAGCPTVGLTYGYNYGESIALSHPDQLLDAVVDILPLLGYLEPRDKQCNAVK